MGTPRDRQPDTGGFRERRQRGGFRGFELGATITGERLYRARGYQAIERIEVPLTNGASLPVIRMSKKRLLGRLDS
jgi:hypothetical protein